MPDQNVLLWIYFSWPLQFDLVMEPPPAWANSRHSYDTATGCPEKWPLRNMCRNSILMTRHYLTLGCASDWMKEMKHYTDLRSDSSSVWNFCAHSPDVIPVVASWDVGSFLWLGPHLTCLTTLSSFAQQHSCLVILRLWLTIISILESQISLYVFSSK